MSSPSAQLLYKRGFLFLIASDRVPVSGYITLSTFPSTFFQLELSKPITRWYAHIADTVLTELSATSLFDLSGVVAVVTGSVMTTRFPSVLEDSLDSSGHWVDDRYYASR